MLLRDTKHTTQCVSARACAREAAILGAADLLHTDCAKCLVRARQPGDALFIPEGWWHAVRSAPASAAVNLWWRSRCASPTHPPHMSRGLQAALLQPCACTPHRPVSLLECSGFH